jgi:hypothetical protein
MIFSGICDNSEEALNVFARLRTVDNKVYYLFIFFYIHFS